MRFKVSPRILGIAVFVLALLAGGCGGGSTTGSSLSSQPQIIVTVSPGSVSLPEGQKQQFTATVSGTTNTAVTWLSSSGTISTSGLFTAPTVSASTIVTVGATSEADTTKSASAAVTVTTPASSLSTLKVMQMNVQHGYGSDNVHDTSRQTSWPANLGADIFSMNEVTYGDSGSGACTNGVCDCTNSTYLKEVENQTGKTWHCLFMQDYPGCSEAEPGEEVTSRTACDICHLGNGRSVVGHIGGLVESGAKLYKNCHHSSPRTRSRSLDDF